MIRGINRYTVEVRPTRSPYFDRAICFVRPEYTGISGLDLHRAARDVVFELDEGVERGGVPRRPGGERRKKRRGWALFLLVALAGAMVGLTAGLLIMRVF